MNDGSRHVCPSNPKTLWANNSHPLLSVLTQFVPKGLDTGVLHGGVELQPGDACGQSQHAARVAQDMDLQHQVHEDHPAPRPLQHAAVPCRQQAQSAHRSRFISDISHKLMRSTQSARHSRFISDISHKLTRSTQSAHRSRFISDISHKLTRSIQSAHRSRVHF